MQNEAKMLTPAAFAEHYIVESIWNGKFAAGTILPAERELAEIIGVTRTTLREVLQRLARDGWLTIQHGKPTQVNNIWHTAGLNVLDTIAQLDDEGSLRLVDQLLDSRTMLTSIYLRAAIKVDPAGLVEIIKPAGKLRDKPRDFIDFDWNFLHGTTLIAQNPIYTLMLNGFKSIYYRVGHYYFERKECRQLASQFYLKLKALIESGDNDAINALIWQYGRDSGVLWNELRHGISTLSDIPKVSYS